jgi:hypothetical protein
MREIPILRSKLLRRLLGFALGLAVGIGVLLATSGRVQKPPPAFRKDAYWLPLFVQCTPAEACESTNAP